MSFPTKVAAVAPGLSGQDVVGRYFSHLFHQASTPGSENIGQNVLQAIVFTPLRNSTWDRIAIQIGIQATDVNTRIRLGIYNDLNGYPSTLLLDAGEVDCRPAGLKSLNISQQLVGGKRYWLAAICNMTPALSAGVPYCYPYTAYEFGSSTAIGFGMYHRVYVAQAYGPLPANFPGGGTYENKVYAIGLRLASIP